VSLDWEPHPGPQTQFCESWQDEVLYGGAAGGGKTDCNIMEAARYVDVKGYKALILRRTFPQLAEILDRAHIYYTRIGGEWRAGDHRYYFPGGGIVQFGHLQHPGDEYQWQTHEFAYIGFDEATQFTPNQLSYLFSRCRSTNPKIPKRIRYCTNPGGPGHEYLKNRFRIGQYPEGRKTFVEYIDVVLPGNVHIKETLHRVFIPAKLADNPSLLNSDPAYVARVMQLPEIERMRLLYGEWDSFEGQVFSELNRTIHAIEPFDIPPEWTRYRSFDWGYSSPFSVGWWAVDYDGNLYRYREWYGGKLDEMTRTVKGMKMNAATIARGIFEREEVERKQGITVRIGPADPAIWSKRRDFKTGIIGPSVADEMSEEGIHWLRGDNDRILGKQQLHSRLAPDDDGKPSIFIFSTCEDWWRTIPLLREHPTNPEDVDHKDAEDHCYDETRYMCMFRQQRPKVKVRADVGSFQAERRRYINAKKMALQRGMSINQAYGMVR
jgi:hypothetical protein